MTAMIALVRACRVLLAVAFWSFVLVVAGIGLMARLAPLADRELMAVRSGSMEPYVGVGAMVAIDTRAARPDPGDVIAFQAPSGTFIVHRVVAAGRDDDGVLRMSTKGDANRAPDAWTVAQDRVVGVVTWQLPLAGYLLAMLGMPSGLLSLVCCAGALACIGWLAEDVEDDLASRSATGADGPRTTTVPRPASRQI